MIKKVKRYFIDYYRILKFVGIRKAIYVLIYFIRKGRAGVELFLVNEYRRYFKSEIESAAEITDDCMRDDAEEIVWVMWWQGVDAVPAVVANCYRSQEKYLGTEYKIVHISESNAEKYIEIPHKIKMAVKENRISITNFSDYIRVSLLEKYGGLWCDSTLFFVGSIPEPLRKNKLITLRRKGEGEKYTMSDNKWTGFFLGISEKNNSLMHFLRICIEKLFSEYGFNPYYYTLDLLFYIAYHDNDSFKQLIDSVPECTCSSDLYFFPRNWAKKYDEETMKESNRRNFVYKTSYKDSISHCDSGLTYGEFLTQARN